MRITLRFLLLLTIFSSMFFVVIAPIDTHAQYSNICNDPEVSEEALIECEKDYDECKLNPSSVPEGNLEGFLECSGNNGCNGMTRYRSYNSVEDCSDLDNRLTPQKYEWSWRESIYAYCDCMLACRDDHYVTRDCEEDLSDCCTIESLVDSEETTGKKILFHKDFEVVIKSIVGDVEIQRRGSDEYVTAKVGDTLRMGDYLATGFESRTTLIYEKVAEMDVKELTNFAIAQFFVQGNLAKTAISLRMGEVTTNVKTIQGLRAKFEIETPTSTAGVRGTTFKVRYNPDMGIAEYFTYEGTLEITEDLYGDMIELNAGKYLYIEEEGFVSEISDIPEYEELTQEEIDIFEKYEQSEYGVESIEGGEDPEMNEIEFIELDDGEDDYSVLYVFCSGLICLLGFGSVTAVGIFLMKRRKKSIAK